jgi:hypothetical protein
MLHSSIGDMPLISSISCCSSAACLTRRLIPITAHPASRRKTGSASQMSQFVSAQAPASVASRVAAQNALLDEAWQTNLKMNPIQATAVGEYRYSHPQRA